MLFQLLRGNFSREIIIQVLMSIPVILLAFSVHESAHAWVAYKLGDPTARNLGRITLNPLKHLDPIGTVSMLLFGVGYAKPVPIRARNFKNPKWGMCLSAAAGPLSNLILGFIGSMIFPGIGIIEYLSIGQCKRRRTYTAKLRSKSTHPVGQKISLRAFCCHQQPIVHTDPVAGKIS